MKNRSKLAAIAAIPSRLAVAALLANLPSQLLAAPLPSIRVLDNAGTEGEVIVLQVTLVGTASKLPSTMDWSTLPLTAQPGVDYEALTGRIVIDPRLSIVGAIRIPTIGNLKVDGTRNFTVRITRGTNARCYDCTANVTIRDDDVLPPPPPPSPTPDPVPPANPTGIVQSCGNGSTVAENATCPPSGRPGVPDSLGLGIPGTPLPEETCPNTLLRCTPPRAPVAPGVPS